MVVDELYAVYLAIVELLAQLHGHVDALANIGMIDQSGIIALDVITQLASLLSHLTTDSIDLDTTLA